MQVSISLMNRGHCVTAVYANYSSLMSYYSRCNSLTQPNKKQRHSFPDSSFPANVFYVFIRAKQDCLILIGGSFMVDLIPLRCIHRSPLLALVPEASNSVTSLYLK